MPLERDVEWDEMPASWIAPVFGCGDRVLSGNISPIVVRSGVGRPKSRCRVPKSAKGPISEGGLSCCAARFRTSRSPMCRSRTTCCRAARLGDKPALIDGPTGRTLTYRQLAERCARARRAWRSGASARATSSRIYCPNVPEYARRLPRGRDARAASTPPPTRSTPPTSWPTSSTTAGARFLVTVPAVPRQGEGRRRRRRRRGDLRVRRGRRRAAVRRAAAARRPAARRSRSIPPRTSSCCRTRAAPRACPRA